MTGCIKYDLILGEAAFKAANPDWQPAAFAQISGWVNTWTKLMEPCDCHHNVDLLLHLNKVVSFAYTSQYRLNGALTVTWFHASFFHVSEECCSSPKSLVYDFTFDCRSVRDMLKLHVLNNRKWPNPVPLVIFISQDGKGNLYLWLILTNLY